MTTASFFHDTKLVLAPAGTFHSTNITHGILNRYLRFFDSIVVATRITSGPETQGDQTSGPGVEVSPITAYASLRDLARHPLVIRRQVREVLRQSDAAIIRLPSIIGLLAFWEAQRTGTPHVIEVVGCPLESYWNHSLAGKGLAPFAYLAHRLAISRASHVVYTTERHLQRRYPCAGRTVSISNVEIEPAAESVIAARIGRTGERPGRIIIGSVGHLDVRYKGQDLLVDAVARLRRAGLDCELELVGDGHGAALRARAERAGVSPHVRFLGRLGRDDLFSWLDTIDVYAQPSRTEGLPRALVEALSRGVPSIGADTGGIPELLPARNLFPVGDDAALAATITKLLDGDIRVEVARGVATSRRFRSDVLNERRNQFLQEFLNHSRTFQRAA